MSINNPSDLCDPIEQVFEAAARGEMVVMVDDEDRENEGDLVIPTEKITQAHISFMMKEARGLICTSISEEVAIKLKLPLQVVENRSQFSTPFTVSIDHVSVSGEGVLAKSRCTTMMRMIDPDSVSTEFVSPGYVFPLIAQAEGVLKRQGQTEGSYDLARIIGCKPSGVICEILRPDGSMMRSLELKEFAKHHGLLFTSVEEILKYRLLHEEEVRETSRGEIDTDHGKFSVVIFREDQTQKEHIVLFKGDISSDIQVNANIHHECVTGDIFGSTKCSCGSSLANSLNFINKEGKGILVYLRSEGRGVTLIDKLKNADLNIQLEMGILNSKHDTSSTDLRIAKKILKKLKVRKANIILSAYNH